MYPPKHEAVKEIDVITDNQLNLLVKQLYTTKDNLEISDIDFWYRLLKISANHLKYLKGIQLDKVLKRYLSAKIASKIR